jgi:L-lactate dehydrogenase complex protein LldF
MNDKGIVFNNNAKKIAFDDEHYEMMMSRYDFFMQNVKNRSNYYSNIDLEKQRAFNIRSKAFKKLDKLLVDFDTNFTKNGGNLLWANDSDEAQKMIYDILSQNKVKKIVKTKSSTIEEIDLISYLEMKKVKVVETNVGDFVCSVFNETPYNFKSSASHKTTSQIADLYTEKFGIKENCNAKQLTAFTKNVLRNDIYNPEALITGANFLVSNTGTIVLTENEGNILKSSTFAPIHIVIAGIDKMITSMEDLGVLLPLSSLYDSNNKVSSLYSFINKPLTQGDKVQKLYLILLNNNRHNILSKDKQRNILSCVQCGACLNVCPIYNTVGGHTYEEYNPGPVGSISLPLTKDIEETAHFCSLCTLCGRCSEICPVNIPLKDLFLENRKDLVKVDKSLIGEKSFLNSLMKKMTNRKNLDKHGSSFKDMELSFHIKKKWGTKRELPKFAKESFSQYWKNINNNK